LSHHSDILDISWYHVQMTRSLTVMSPEESYHRSLGDKHQIPARSKLDESDYPAACSALFLAAIVLLTETPRPSPVRLVTYCHPGPYGARDRVGHHHILSRLPLRLEWSGLFDRS
jgi:hypothetical protein